MGDCLKTPGAANKNQSRALLWELVSQADERLFFQGVLALGRSGLSLPINSKEKTKI